MYTVLEDGKVANEAGEIAVRHFPLTQKYLKIGKREYVFVVMANISLAWVHPDDLQRVLDYTQTCCGGNTVHPFRLSDEVHVKRWLGVSER